MQFVVFLRGVNAGPRNRVKMDELRAALEQAGFEHVRTHVQSGNVVLADHGCAAAVAAGVRKVLGDRFALDVEVIVRDERALRAIVADNPLRHIATDGQRQFVIFCSEAADPSRLPDVAAPEVLAVRGTELHAWCPNGVRDGKLMGALARRPPAPTTTFRNWNTVAKLESMLREAE